MDILIFFVDINRKVSRWSFLLSGNFAITLFYVLLFVLTINKDNRTMVALALFLVSVSFLKILTLHLVARNTSLLSHAGTFFEFSSLIIFWYYAKFTVLRKYFNFSLNI